MKGKVVKIDHEVRTHDFFVSVRLEYGRDCESLSLGDEVFVNKVENPYLSKDYKSDFEKRLGALEQRLNDVEMVTKPIGFGGGICKDCLLPKAQCKCTTAGKPK